jgi:hypothetical protein
MKIMWQYNFNYLGVKNLVDPRIAIAKHIDWRTSTKQTTWSQPEPDNYNASIFSSIPLEHPDAKHQIFYKSEHYRGWFSVYYIKPSLAIAYNDWTYKQPFWAKWYSQKHAAFRNKTTLLGDKPYRQTRDLSVNERLYQMKHYERLKYKCDDGNIVDVRVGQPHPGLLDFIDSQPEVEDEDLL